MLTADQSSALKPHVLVVDDDDRLRSLLRRYLAEQGFVVSTAANAADARAKLKHLDYDLMVLDIMMPGENGIELTQSLRKVIAPARKNGLAQQLPILLLTARGEVSDRIEGLEVGADDYLHKPFEPRELVLRINAILRRMPKPPPAPPELVFGAWRYDAQRDELRRHDEVVRLTDMEAGLMRVLAAEPGVPLSREALAEKSKGKISDRTIDVQVTRLRRKIEPDVKNPRYLVTVRGEGYMLMPDIEFMKNKTVPSHARKFPLSMRFKRLLPRSLFGRTLLIIVVPTLITLAAATFVFFDRHWTTVTNRLSYAVAGDVAVVVDLMQKSSNPESTAAVVNLAAEEMNLYVSFSPGLALADREHTNFNPLRDILQHALDDRLSYPFEIDIRHAQEMIAIHVGVPEGVYTILCPERRIYTPTTAVFIAWMVGSSILLSAIALLFMRNQIRPIRRLADAAEAIGKGRDVPWFKLEGAAEVRQAAAALMVMRDRLRRQITQRTAMLAGVSHDLRTPLTRMRLQLALMPDSDEKKEFTTDIVEMETMLDAYLAFARGEEAEPETETDLAELLGEVVNAAKRQNPNIRLNVPEKTLATLRRNAMKRCFSNLLGNAVRYGKRAEVNVVMRDQMLDIVVDDDGPGISSERREDMFRPFTRMEESRNRSTGGVGLGLTIARDIARFHGGDVVLENSPLGGLRARVWLPV